ncbi:MAG: formamidopyrimidine-DNA glycosylase [Phycisphaerales bacterium]|nr:MAG: formamidopyrimidine-DNA glycosylase [Phycisphaerales bacterium]
MPELPDIEAYIAALRPRVVEQPIESAEVFSPFLVRTFDPPLDAVVGRRVTTLERLGKRIVFGLDGELYLVFHLMIAGRFRWSEQRRRVGGRIALAAFTFPSGTLTLTEAGSKKRAGLHVVAGRAGLTAHDPGGIDVRSASLEALAERLRGENHTLKRALTDPRLFSGIGNAYSDEILHAARLSPLQWTTRLNQDEIERLWAAAQRTLAHWTGVLCAQVTRRFPGAGDVTAFREGFAAHGRFGKPCPTCGATIQRIRYADNETNYCPACQTGGRILADRSLSRLLRDDWPRSIDEA